MDYLDDAMVVILLFSWAALCWVLWLYIATYRRLVHSDRDRDRLIARIGLYHNLPIGIPSPQDRLPDLPTDLTVPPAFRTRKPVPPPGWHSKGDL